MQNCKILRQPLLGERARKERERERKKEKKMPFIVATYVYASSQVQRTHSARTNCLIVYKLYQGSGSRTSKKVALRSLLKVIESDVRSVTGHNLRAIMMRSDSPVHHVQNLKPDDVTFKYREIPVGEQYRVDLIKEIIDVKHKQLEVPGFAIEQLDEIMQHICVS
jgi:hypothetical protein